MRPGFKRPCFCGNKSSLKLSRIPSLFTGLATYSSAIFIGTDKALNVYLFTDGFQDQFGGTKDSKYKRKNLYAFIEKIYQNPFAEQEQLLGNEFDNWIGNTQQTDDVLVFGFKI